MHTWIAILNDLPTLLTWSFLLKTFLILLGSLIALRLIHLTTNQYGRFLRNHREMEDEEEKRITTLLAILKSASSTVIIAVAALLILDQMGLNMTPILTGAGVLGVALAFGTQSVVKDLLYGFFILAENQFGLGDSLQVGTLSGIVQKMTFRTVTLRDIEGRTHILPNGEINRVTLLPKGGLPCHLVVSLRFSGHNPTEAIAFLLAFLPDLMRESPYAFLEPPVLRKIEELNSQLHRVEFRIKTPPLSPWNSLKVFQERFIYDAEQRFPTLDITISATLIDSI